MFNSFLCGDKSAIEMCDIKCLKFEMPIMDPFHLLGYDIVKQNDTKNELSDTDGQVGNFK